MDAFWGGRTEACLKLTELIHPEALGFPGHHGFKGRLRNPITWEGPDFNDLLSDRDGEFDPISCATDIYAPSADHPSGRGQGRCTMRYGMVIDLDKCTGCMSCDVACKRENFTPPGVHWSKVHIYETGAYPQSKLRSLPTLCMHCDEPACRKACPTGATSQATRRRGDHRQRSLHRMRLLCPGLSRTRRVRSTATEPRAYHAPHDFTPVEKIGYFQKLGTVEHGKGVIEKCTFCLHRLEQGGEPACVETCPSGARVFGDLDDPESEVARLVASRGAKGRLEDQKTKPKVLVHRTGGASGALSPWMATRASYETGGGNDGSA